MKDEKIFKQKLENWAKKVLPYCIDIAKKQEQCGAFYAFQTAPRKEPEVLLLGLNPGDKWKTTYKAQCENKDWKIPQGMTIEAFIQANPFEKEKDNWTILKSFEKVKNVHSQLKTAFTYENKNIITN